MDDDRYKTRDQAAAIRAALVKLATGHLEAGVLHEPRGYFDVIDLNNDGNIVQGHPEVFRNGEQFPVRLTHMVAAMTRLDAAEPPQAQDERLVQRVGLRMEFHNQYYMNPEFLPIALWGNTVVAASQAITPATSSWMFPTPFVLSARDTLDVQVQLDAAPASPQRITVAFSGVGFLSGRPYFLSGDRLVTDGASTQLTTTAFRNDGSEPIIVTDGTVVVTAPEDSVDATGDIRAASLQVRQAGNGTNAQWFRGPTNPAIERMPAQLWGAWSGRAVVHTFPGDGLIWEPGEGIDLQVQGLTTTPPPDARVAIALLGYITVT